MSQETNTKSITEKSLPTYETATGPIEFTLKSDLLFHYVMQRSKPALIGLVCSLKGISPDTVKDLEVMNPIDISAAPKETVMDLKLTLNSNEIINIELQVYWDKYWIKRSLLYMCRGYDCLEEGDDYSKLKPTTHFCIADLDILPGNTSFYSSYYLMEEKTHQIYSKNLSIGVLQLQYIDNATEVDSNNNLVFWAKLFNAKTWEEFKDIACDNPVIKEVGDLMLMMNMDQKEREILEGQRRYREQVASQYTAGYTDAEEKLTPVIDELQEKIDAANKTISEDKKTIAERDKTIADLQAQLKRALEKAQKG
ncbi:MAG: Rpn family recombination-promoting nuclease/putative transposase [Butyrivibrio sp.]|nr:Rpn family recombination-promoting nuclease/putative transposase [Butyrivibrio sp.]